MLLQWPTRCDGMAYGASHLQLAFVSRSRSLQGCARRVVRMLFDGNLLLLVAGRLQPIYTTKLRSKLRWEQLGVLTSLVPAVLTHVGAVSPGNFLHKMSEVWQAGVGFTFVILRGLDACIAADQAARRADEDTRDQLRDTARQLASYSLLQQAARRLKSDAASMRQCIRQLQ